MSVRKAANWITLEALGLLLARTVIGSGMPLLLGMAVIGSGMPLRLLRFEMPYWLFYPLQGVVVALLWLSSPPVALGFFALTLLIGLHFELESWKVDLFWSSALCTLI